MTVNLRHLLALAALGLYLVFTAGANAAVNDLTSTDSTVASTSAGRDAGPSFDSSTPSAGEILKYIHPVPEVSTWGMLMIGFAGLGYTAFRGSAKGRLEDRAT